ncbi:MAG: ribosomal protein S18-alanine N-acetyltransferase [Leptospirales bacterium]
MEELLSEEEICPGDFRVVCLNVSPWPDLLQIFFDRQTEQDRADFFLGQALLSEVRTVPVARYFGLFCPKGPGLVGFLGAWFVAGEAEIHHIYLDPQFRRKGLGTLFLEKFLGYAAGDGVDTVYLEVRRSNVSARTLYERIGFQLTGVRPDYYTEPVEDALLMAYKTAMKRKEGQGGGTKLPVLMEGALAGAPRVH